MQVFVATEQRFFRTNGRIVTRTIDDYGFWKRYLVSFDQVTVVARVAEGNSLGTTNNVEGQGVKVLPLPNYRGLSQCLRHFLELKHEVRAIASQKGAFILRVPGVVGSLLQTALTNHKRPYAVEVVGDPYDVFSPGAYQHVLRPLFRWWFAKRLKEQCQEAVANAYVTREALQRRYPPSGVATFYSSVGWQRREKDVIAASDVALGPRQMVHPREFGRRKQSIVLIAVVSLEDLYKAPDVLIRAVGLCSRAGLDLKLRIVGDGRHRPALERQAASEGITDRVLFVGALLGGDAVLQQLNEADLFVLPSRQEGLPRAMLEAMSQGLPCIGSTVGGIPELLAGDDLVPPGNPEALAAKILEVASDPDRMTRMSQRNLQVAAEYGEEVLSVKRRRFYDIVRGIADQAG